MNTLCTPAVWQKHVLQWFQIYGRQHLPWQNPVTPYRVWISEVMLQQTQVSTVIPYFHRFIESFPDIASLAAASLDAVLSHWSGLGYYQRARNLHRAAQQVMTQWDGKLPESVSELTTLSGIGRSTAGAIASIAFGKQEPILDGNVRRVLNRVHCIEDPKRALDRLWQLAEQYTPEKNTAAYTQAMMDLGATVCTRTRPACEVCPVQTYCGAYAVGRVLDYPKPLSRAKKPERSTGFLLPYDPETQTWLLERRPMSGIWGGLWSAIEYPIDVNFDDWVNREWGCMPHIEHALPPRAHVFTHFRLWMYPMVIHVNKAQAITMQSNHRQWKRASDWMQAGLPSAIRKLLVELSCLLS